MINSYLVLKRLMDIVGASLFIIIFSPLYLVTAILIWYEDKHWPFYSQIRVGLNGKHFNFYKFRSMVANADQILFSNPELYKQIRSGNNKIKNDPRITKIGHFIRKYSIDEIPQMLNVLKGDMSIVGPRALRPDEHQDFISKNPDYEETLKTICTVNPGLTGLWQISGRSTTTFESRMALDLYYAQKKSIIFDIIILVKTPLVVLKGQGAE